MKQLAFVALFTLFIVACDFLNPSPAATTTPQTDVNNLEVTATPHPVTTTPTTPVSSAPREATSSDATVDALRNSVQPRLLESWPSPGGKRQAQVVRYDCAEVGEEGQMAYEELTIAADDGTNAEVVDSQLINCGGLGAAGLGSLFWSPNGRYFYYTTARQGVPDGCGFWNRPLMRVDVDSFAVETLGAGPRSPDGSKLATWREGELVVWDVSGGDLLRLPAAAPDLSRGPLAWSPDSQMLAYVQVASFCPLSGISYVAYVDITGEAQYVLPESESPTFGSVTWTSNEEIALVDETGAEWRFLIATGEFQRSD